jgi:hypothetical protein
VLPVQAGAAAPAGDASAAAAAQPSHGISDATIVKNSMKHYPRVTHGEHKGFYATPTTFKADFFKPALDRCVRTA